MTFCLAEPEVCKPYPVDKTRFPHYHLVPKDLDANLEFRAILLEEAAKDPGFARSLWKMCAEDCLFYLNTFCWTFDPRDTTMPKKPFITYEEFQDEAVEIMLRGIEKGFDIATPKSRTMGASWMGLAIIEWMWHFNENPLVFLLISRNEDYVDKKGSSKSLFWKIDFLHKNQPKWLLPTGREMGDKDPNRKKLSLVNADTGATIDGESTTGDVARGARYAVIFMDEFAAFELNDGFKALAATRDVANCRIFNSTPQGAANAFHEIVHETAAKVYYMHWTKHPKYRQGLYTSEKDASGIQRLKLLDTDFTGMVQAQRKGWDEPKDFIFPEQYPYILDGKVRSPWYDTQCARCATEQEIAQELDIDFQGSDFQFFDQQEIQQLVAEYCRIPTMRGRLKFDPHTLEPLGFEPDDKGPIHLWFNIPGGGALLNDRTYFDGKRFAAGADVSFGTGASNSANSIVDLETGMKVAVWRDSHYSPDRFCDEVIAMCKWFNDAFLIHDATGAAGRSFTKRLLERGYKKIYYRTSEERTRARISDQPGYYMNPEDRAVLLRDYRIKLRDREFINQSEQGMIECLQFVVQPGGKIEHSKALNTQDPTGAREAHGDEAIADALASRALSMKKTDKSSIEPKAPYMSIAWRLKEEQEQALAAAEEDW